MYPLTPKSIGFVSDLLVYPTMDLMVLNTSPLGLTMPEKSGRQTEGVDTRTHTHTHTHTHTYRQTYTAPFEVFSKLRN